MHALWLILSEDGQHRPRQDDFTGGTDPAAVKKALGHGLGQISRALGSHGVDPRTGVRALNRLQKFLREETRLGIPALSHEECLVGLMARGATMFPSALAYGATWNPDLVERAAQAIGREARSVGCHQGLAPGPRRLPRRALGPHRGDPGRGPLPRGRPGHSLRPRPAGREARPPRDAQALRGPLVERGGAQPRAGPPGLARAQRRLPAPLRDGGEAGARRVGHAGLPRHRQRVLPRLAPPPHRGAPRRVGLRRADRGRLHRHQPPVPAPQPRRGSRRGGGDGLQCRARHRAARRRLRRAPGRGDPARPHLHGDDRRDREANPHREAPPRALREAVRRRGSHRAAGAGHGRAGPRGGPPGGGGAREPTASCPSTPGGASASP